MLSLGIVLAGTVALHAQTVTATVPFNFYMGRTAMSKGAYRVDEINGGAVIMLRTGKTTKAITVHNVAGKPLAERPRLVFHRYGETYFLSEIWTGRSAMGRELARTSHEKELRAGLPAPPSPVIVALVQ
jgi:hypothetical protein